MKAMKNNAQKIDDATEDLFTISQSRKKAVLVILQTIPLSKIVEMLNFNAEGSLYRDVKDSYRYGSQHLDVLAIIFSGANNSGVPPLDFNLMPIIFKDRDICSLKDNFERYFPCVVELQDCIPGIKKSLLERAFLKNLSTCTTGSSTLFSNPTRNISSESVSSSIPGDERWTKLKTVC
jgi:hypothetical protein